MDQLGTRGEAKLRKVYASSNVISQRQRFYTIAELLTIIENGAAGSYREDTL